MDASLDGDMSRIILVTVTLTYGLVNRKIVSAAYRLSFEVKIPNLVLDSCWDGGVLHTILVHFDLDIDF